MSAYVPLLMMGFAGLLAGGVWSTAKQGNKIAAVILALLAALALVGGLLWLGGEA